MGLKRAVPLFLGLFLLFLPLQEAHDIRVGVFFHLQVLQLRQFCAEAGFTEPGLDILMLLVGASQRLHSVNSYWLVFEARVKSKILGVDFLQLALMVEEGVETRLAQGFVDALVQLCGWPLREMHRVAHSILLHSLQSRLARDQRIQEVLVLKLHFPFPCYRTILYDLFLPLMKKGSRYCS